MKTRSLLYSVAAAGILAAVSLLPAATVFAASSATITSNASLAPVFNPLGQALNGSSSAAASTHSSDSVVVSVYPTGTPLAPSYLVRVIDSSNSPLTLNVTSGTLTTFAPTFISYYVGWKDFDVTVLSTPSGSSVSVPLATAPAGSFAFTRFATWAWTPGSASATLTATGVAPFTTSALDSRALSASQVLHLQVGSSIGVFSDSVTPMTCTGVSTTSQHTSVSSEITWPTPQPGQSLTCSSSEVTGGYLALPGLAETATPVPTTTTTTTTVPRTAPSPTTTTTVAPAPVSHTNQPAPVPSSTIPALTTTTTTPTTTTTTIPSVAPRSVPPTAKLHFAAAPVSHTSHFPWWLLVLIIAACLAIITEIVRRYRKRCKIRKISVDSTSDTLGDSDE